MTDEEPKVRHLTPTEAARAQLAGFLTLPVVEQRERPWRPDETTTEQLLAAAERKALPRRFTSEPITGFGALA